MFYNCYQLENISFIYLNFNKSLKINEMNKISSSLFDIIFQYINYYDSFELTNINQMIIVTTVLP